MSCSFQMLLSHPVNTSVPSVHPALLPCLTAAAASQLREQQKPPKMIYFSRFLQAGQKVKSTRHLELKFHFCQTEKKTLMAFFWSMLNFLDGSFETMLQILQSRKTSGGNIFFRLARKKKNSVWRLLEAPFRPLLCKQFLYFWCCQAFASWLMK